MPKTVYIDSKGRVVILPDCVTKEQFVESQECLERARKRDQEVAENEKGKSGRGGGVEKLRK